jgi:hypothetical protein
MGVPPTEAAFRRLTDEGTNPMLISQTTYRNQTAYLINGAPIAGRDGFDDSWTLLHSASSTVAVIPTADGEDFELIVVDESADRRDLWTEGFWSDDEPGFPSTWNASPPMDALLRVAGWAHTEVEMALRLREGQ